MPEIRIEGKPVRFLGSLTGSSHLYLVLVQPDGVELVLRGGPQGDFGTGRIVMEDSVPMAGSRDARPPEDRDLYGSRVLDLGDRPVAEVWDIMRQQARAIDAAAVPFVLFVQNSNSAIESLLHVVGIDIAASLPDQPGRNASYPGLGHILDLFPFVLEAGPGGHVLAGGARGDRLTGGAGNDTILGGAGDDVLAGGAGNDLIFGGSGANLIRAGAGNDTVHGGSGSDTIHGDEGRNRLFGHDGDDLILGGAGGDYIGGGAGNDTIRGGAGADTIWGGHGDDNIGGGAGDDIIIGGAGNNRIWGGWGDDTIHSGAGRDVMTGGPGADVFVFADAARIGIGASRDAITDFAPGIDRIDLRGLATRFNGSDGMAGDGAASFYLYARGRLLIGDQTGDGHPDWVLELHAATLPGAADFLL